MQATISLASTVAGYRDLRVGHASLFRAGSLCLAQQMPVLQDMPMQILIWRAGRVGVSSHTEASSPSSAMPGPG
jgi:hypothetical protein